MSDENIKFFSPRTRKSIFDELSDGQLIEASYHYYKDDLDLIFKEKGFELFRDKAESKKRGWRIYRVIKIREEKDSPKILQFNPEELVI
jgi:hypothetical protein